MRSLRMRFSVRWLMLFVCVVALLCTYLAAWQASRIGGQAVQDVARRQNDVTSSVLSDVTSKDTGFQGQCAESGGSTPSSTGVGWFRALKIWEGSDVRQTPMIDLVVSGGYDGSKLRPIRIKFRGDRGRTESLEALTQAYREQNWQYEITKE